VYFGGGGPFLLVRVGFYNGTGGELKGEKEIKREIQDS
jgi:hypothetical protein